MKTNVLNFATTIALSLAALTSHAQFCSPAINQFANPQITNANQKTDMVLGVTYPITFRFANTGDPDSVIANTLEIIISLPNSVNMAFQPPYLATGSGCGIWTVDMVNSSADAIVLRNTGGVTSASTSCDIQFLVKPVISDVLVSYSVAVNRTRPSCVGDADASAANNTKSGNLMANAAPLPIGMQSFTAIAKGCDVQLDWITATEKNMNHFDVEYSADAKQFAKVGTVPARNLSTGSTYRFAYSQPAGTGYYRLKAIDNDASFEYSAIAAATTQCGAEGIKVYPNPTREYVEVSGLKSGATVQVFNVAGQQIYSIITQSSTQKINTTKWSSGNYQIRIINAGGQKTQNFTLSKI
jgi:hypothetical protein